MNGSWTTDGTPAPGWLEPLDHTADAGFFVTAETAGQLFERAAWGMFDLLCDMTAVRPAEAETVELELEADGDDLPLLFVRWLTELNFRHITRSRLFCRFQVHEVSGRHLKAEVSGEAIRPEAGHTVHTEIKAVTFHGLEIESAPGQWRARVIFDL